MLNYGAKPSRKKFCWVPPRSEGDALLAKCSFILAKYLVEKQKLQHYSPFVYLYTQIYRYECWSWRSRQVRKNLKWRGNRKRFSLHPYYLTKWGGGALIREGRWPREKIRGRAKNFRQFIIEKNLVEAEVNWSCKGTQKYYSVVKDINDDGKKREWSRSLFFSLSGNNQLEEPLEIINKQ